jgi:hypothetical protein
LWLAAVTRKRTRPKSGQLGQLPELSITIAQLLSRNPQLVQQRQLQVGQWRMFRIDDMPPALEPPGASAQKQGWQRTVRVPVAVADARPIQKDRMIEQRPVAILRIAQFFQIFCEQRQMISADKVCRSARGRT